MAVRLQKRGKNDETPKAKAGGGYGVAEVGLVETTHAEPLLVARNSTKPFLEFPPAWTPRGDTNFPRTFL